MTNRPIPYDQMKEVISNQTSLLSQAIIATQYGLASRAGELIQYKHRDGTITNGLLKENIVERNNLLVCEIPNFKNKSKQWKKPYISKEEKFIYNPIKQYLEYCQNQLFPISDRQFREIIKKGLPDNLSSHALRHSRATHLAEIFNFDAYEIQAFLGHSRLDTSAIYVKADISRSANKMEVVLNDRNGNNSKNR